MPPEVHFKTCVSINHNQLVKQIRENIYQVTYTEIGKPPAKGVAQVPDLGELMIDDADIRYVKEISVLGYEPTFFISRSAPLGGRFVVVGRQQVA